MKTVASLITLVGIASCSAQQKDDSSITISKNLRAAAPEATKSGTNSFAEGVFHAIADALPMIKPAVSDAFASVMDPCPAHLGNVGQRYADGLIAGFKTSYPELTQCLPKDSCAAAQLGHVVERIYKTREPNTVDVLELEYILYHSIFKELQACQKTPQQALQLAQITAVLKKSDTDPIWALKHQVVNAVIHSQELYAKFYEDVEQLRNKNYEKAGQLFAEEYLTLAIGRASDTQYAKETHGDLAEVNVIALEHSIAEAMPDLVKSFTEGLAAAFGPHVKDDKACSQDIDALKHDIDDFVNKFAKYVIRDGQLDPDWDKIADLWDVTKEKLALEIGEIMADCAMSSTASEMEKKYVREVVTRTLGAQTIESMKPVILQAFTETDTATRDLAEYEASVSGVALARKKAQTANKIAISLLENAHGGLHILKGDKACSQDIDALKHDIDDFINKVAKYMVRDGKIDPDWGKIADVWMVTKDKLILNIGEIMADCAMLSTTSEKEDIHEVVRRALQSQTIDTMKPVLLEAFAETNAVAREQAETEASAENAAVARKQAQAVGKIVGPLLASTQGALYMNTFTKSVKASEGLDSATIGLRKPSAECKKAYLGLETGLIEAIDSVVIYNKTIARGIELAAATLSMYGEVVIKECFSKDKDFAARLVKENVNALGRTHADAGVLIKGTGSAPTHASEKDATVLAAPTTASVRGSNIFESFTTSDPYSAAEIVYDEEGEEGDSSAHGGGGFPIRLTLIIAATACGFITSIAFASCLIFKCKKTSPASTTPLLEGQANAEAQESSVPPVSNTDEAAAFQETLPEELPAGV